MKCHAILKLCPTAAAIMFWEFSRPDCPGSVAYNNAMQRIDVIIDGLSKSFDWTGFDVDWTDATKLFLYAFAKTQ